jgi:16S rRNA (cytosine967-C5)-methyltransferase
MRSRSARAIALEILQRIDREGAYANILLDSYLKRAYTLKRVDRSLITELVNGTLRWRKRIDWVISRFSHKPPDRLPGPLLNIIRMGLYQILFLDRIPPRAAVDESVKLTKAFGFTSRAGYVNGLLRNIQRTIREIDYPDLRVDPVAHIAVVYSFPEWLVERWISMWGMERTIEICASTNKIPPLTLRTNTFRISRETLSARLEEVGSVGDTYFSPVGLVFKNPQKPISELEAYQKGWFQVQDEASQLISLWLSPLPGERVLDTCCAPGGKTTHLAELMENKGEILAVDIHESRLGLLEASCSRLGIKIVESMIADLTREDALADKGLFDKILLDPPCSGLGILRRHPEGKWSKGPEEIDRMSKLQWKLIGQVSRALKPGGTLVYSVCTTSREENEGIIEDFLAENRSFRLIGREEAIPERYRSLVCPKGFFRTSPSEQDMDGFFAAKMVRLGVAQ